MNLKLFIVAVCLLCFVDLDVTASAMRELHRQEGSVTHPLQEGNSRRIWTTLLPQVSNHTQPILVQKQQEFMPGDDVFQGYSCQSDSTCFHGGRCLDTTYQSSLCNCTEDWLGPQCKFSSASMLLELHLRPIVRRSFMSCLNLTGTVDGVHAANVFAVCKPGNTECWVREGGSNAIKVFFWCLNTGYGMLLTEGKPRVSARLDSYADTFRKLSRRHWRRQSVDLPQGLNLPLSIRLEENVDNRNDPRFTTSSAPRLPRLGTPSEGGSENRFNSRRFGLLRRFGQQQNTNSISDNSRNSQRNINPPSRNNFAVSLPLARYPSNSSHQSSTSRISNSTAAQQTMLTGRRYLRNLFRLALAHGQVSQRAIQRMFGPSTSARKASLKQNSDKNSEYEADYFSAPNGVDIISNDLQ